MEILLTWLNSSVKLSEEITDLRSQFSNGYLLAELLYKHNQILSFPKNFSNSHSKSAIISNFSRIQPALQKLHVSLDANDALGIIREDQHAAAFLLRSLKDSLDRASGVVDMQVFLKTHSKNKVFPLMRVDFSKSTYYEKENELFTLKLKKCLEPAHAISMKKCQLRFENAGKKWKITMEKQRKADEEEVNQEHRDMRTLELEKKHRNLSLMKTNQLESNQNWKDNLTIRKTQNQSTMTFKLTQSNRNEELKRLRLENAKEKTEKEIQLFESRKQLRAEKKYTGLVSSTRLAKVRANLRARERELHSEPEKKERDRRLRKLIVDLKTLHLVQEAKTNEERILGVLARESHQEEEIRYELHRARQFEPIMITNKNLYDELLNNYIEQQKARELEMIQREKATDEEETELKQQEATNLMMMCIENRSLIAFESLYFRLKPFVIFICELMFSSVSESEKINIPLKKSHQLARGLNSLLYGKEEYVEGYLSDLISDFASRLSDPSLAFTLQSAYKLVIDEAIFGEKRKRLSLAAETTQAEPAQSEEESFRGFLTFDYPQESVVSKSEQLYKAAIHKSKSEPEEPSESTPKAEFRRPQFKIALLGPSVVDKNAVANYLCNKFNLTLIDPIALLTENIESKMSPGRSEDLLLEGKTVDAESFAALLAPALNQDTDLLILDVPFNVDEAQAIEAALGEGKDSAFNAVFVLHGGENFEGEFLQFEVTRRLSEMESLEQLLGFYQQRSLALGTPEVGMKVDHQKDLPSLIDFVSSKVQETWDLHEKHCEKLKSEFDAKNKASEDFQVKVNELVTELESKKILEKEELTDLQSKTLTYLSEQRDSTRNLFIEKCHESLKAFEKVQSNLSRDLISALLRVWDRARDIGGQVVEFVATQAQMPTASSAILSTFIQNYNNFVKNEFELISTDIGKAEWFLRLEVATSKCVELADKKFASLLNFKNSKLGSIEVLNLFKISALTFTAFLEIELQKMEIVSSLVDLKLACEAGTAIPTTYWVKPSLQGLKDKINAIKSVKDVHGLIKLFEDDTTLLIDSLTKPPVPEKNAKKPTKEKQVEENPLKKALFKTLVAITSSKLQQVKSIFSDFTNKLSSEVDMLHSTVDNLVRNCFKKESKVLEAFSLFVFEYIENAEAITKDLKIEPFSFTISKRKQVIPEPKQEISEVFYENRLSISSLFESFNFLSAYKNFLGMIEQTRLLELYHMLRLSHHQLPQKWIKISLPEFISFVERLDTQNSKMVSLDLFMLHLVLAEYKLIPSEAVEFYERYGRKKPYLSRSEFLETKLFFEIEEHLYTELEIKAIKALIFKAYRNDNDQIDLLKLTNGLTHLSRQREKENLSQKKYFELMFAE